MAQVIFHDVHDHKVSNPNLEELRGHFLSLDYWFSGIRDTSIAWIEGTTIREIAILSHRQLGLALYFSDTDGDEFWSLGDPARFEEKAVMGDGSWQAAGFFLSLEQAWLAIEEFCKTGKRTDKIAWIGLADLPDTDWWFGRDVVVDELRIERRFLPEAARMLAIIFAGAILGGVLRILLGAPR